MNSLEAAQQKVIKSFKRGTAIRLILGVASVVLVAVAFAVNYVVGG